MLRHRAGGSYEQSDDVVWRLALERGRAVLVIHSEKLRGVFAAHARPQTLSPVPLAKRRDTQARRRSDIVAARSERVQRPKVGRGRLKGARRLASGLDDAGARRASRDRRRPFPEARKVLVRDELMAGACPERNVHVS